ncbi:MAG: DMT family transporter [Anaerolineales bacterium]|nr:DMT family transporter [Anaerolineales bacterium]
MLSSSVLGVLSGLTAAFVWGGADFSGGLAARKQNQFQVLVGTALSGLVVLIAAMLIRREGMLDFISTFWAALAGLLGAFGVAALYRGLSLGNVVSVAPAAAVISTGLPVIYSLFFEGSPKVTQFMGFGLALVGIWLTSGSESMKLGWKAKENFLLAFVAGIGFSGFFILIDQVEPGKIFSPLIVSRLMTLVVAFSMIKFQDVPMPALFSNPAALFAGVMDAGGNIFYMVAIQFTRVDVAVVLSSLCPAVTVVLAALILKEKILHKQWMGVVACLIAAALIAL